MKIFYVFYCSPNQDLFRFTNNEKLKLYRHTVETASFISRIKENQSNTI